MYFKTLLLISETQHTRQKICWHEKYNWLANTNTIGKNCIVQNCYQHAKKFNQAVFAIAKEVKSRLGVRYLWKKITGMTESPDGTQYIDNDTCGIPLHTSSKY